MKNYQREKFTIKCKYLGNRVKNIELNIYPMKMHKKQHTKLNKGVRKIEHKQEHKLI